MDDEGQTGRARGAATRHARTRRAAVVLLALAAVAVLRAPELVLGPLTGDGTRAVADGRSPTDPRTATVGERTEAVEPQAPPAPGAPGRAAPDGSAEPAPDAPTRRAAGASAVVAEVRGGWRAEAGAGEAAALAVQAAHRWARADTPPTDVAPPASVVTVEAVERPGARHAVVTLLVATGERLERVGVPIRFADGGPVLAGPPWPLPAPTLTSEPLAGEATGDAVLLDAARRALDAVGIDGARLTGLEVTDGWPFIARLDDGGAAWLRWHLDRFVVAGLPLARAGEAPPRMTNTEANETTENGG